MGIKLYVDDIRKEPKGWVRVRTITDAIRLLAYQDVDEVSLDHDITHAILPDDPASTRANIYQPVCCPETFEPVARYIALMPKRPRIRFHTANPDGEKKMREILGL